MSWQRLDKITELPAIITGLKNMIKSGNEAIEHLRCVFTIKDNPTIQCLTPCDFIDSLESSPEITKISLYQMVEK
jgi:hypothetical protein